MQNEDPIPDPAEIAHFSLLEHSVVVLRALWSSLGTKDRHGLRRCSSTMREAVDAQASCLEEQGNAREILSGAACARLHGVRTVALRSMPTLRMLVGPNQPAGAAFPRLQSLRMEVGNARAWGRPHARLMSVRSACHALRMEVVAGA
jgi:hypothetical protein